MGKRVLLPRMLVTSIVATYDKSECYGHSGVLRNMALIKRDYVCSHLRHYVESSILSCDVCQAAKSRPVDTTRQPRPLPVPDTKWHSVSVDFVSGMPSTTRGHDAIMTVVDLFFKHGMFIPCRKDVTADDLVYVFLPEVIQLKGCPRQIASDADKLFESQAWKELAQLSRFRCTKRWPTALEATAWRSAATSQSFNACVHTASSVTTSGMPTFCSPRLSLTT